MSDVTQILLEYAPLSKNILQYFIGWKGMVFRVLFKAALSVHR
jgi:hypothetical protein